MSFLELFIYLEPILTPMTMILILYFPYLRLLKKTNSIICILKRDKRLHFKIKISILFAFIIALIILFSKDIRILKAPSLVLLIYCITIPAYPQIICESGIIGPNYYIKWSNIKNVTLHLNTFTILLEKPDFFNKNYKINCNHDSRTTFITILNQKTNIIVKEENIC